MAEFQDEAECRIAIEKEHDTSERSAPTGTKNVAELLSMDAEDESLRKYKEGLGLGCDLGDLSDPRRVIVDEFRISFCPPEKGVPKEDIVHDLSSQEGLDNLANEGIEMVEGIQFKFKIKFRVQHEIVNCIKFCNKIGSKFLPSSEK